MRWVPIKMPLACSITALVSIAVVRLRVSSNAAQ